MCSPTWRPRSAGYWKARLAGGCYAAAPDEGALAAALTQDLQSLNGDKHLRLLHSAADLPERGDEAAELAALSAYAALTAGGIARAPAVADRGRAGNAASA